MEMSTEFVHLDRSSHAYAPADASGPFIRSAIVLKPSTLLHFHKGSSEPKILPPVPPEAPKEAGTNVGFERTH
jgi:hypothetical protein